MGVLDGDLCDGIRPLHRQSINAQSQEVRPLGGLACVCVCVGGWVRVWWGWNAYVCGQVTEYVCVRACLSNQSTHVARARARACVCVWICVDVGRFFIFVLVGKNARRLI